MKFLQFICACVLCNTNLAKSQTISGTTRPFGKGSITTDSEGNSYTTRPFGKGSITTDSEGNSYTTRPFGKGTITSGSDGSYFTTRPFGRRTIISGTTRSSRPLPYAAISVIPRDQSEQPQAPSRIPTRPLAGVSQPSNVQSSIASASSVLSLQKLARSGNAAAQFILGVCYADGTGVKADPEKAFQLWEMSAQQGNVEAQFYVACCYSEGDGVEADLAQAANWFFKAASEGDAESQYNLAYMLQKGEGVLINEVDAVKWYQLAAAQGLPEANFNLARCFATGRGTQVNYSKAYVCYNLALPEYQQAAKLIQHLETLMSPEAIKEAQESVAALRAKIGELEAGG